MTTKLRHVFERLPATLTFSTEVEYPRETVINVSTTLSPEEWTALGYPDRIEITIKAAP